MHRNESPELETAEPVEVVEHYTDEAAGVDVSHAVHPFPVRVVESVAVQPRGAQLATFGTVVVPVAGAGAVAIVQPDPTRRALTIINHGTQALVLAHDPGMASAGIGLTLPAGAQLRLNVSAEVYVCSATATAGACGYASESQPW